MIKCILGTQHWASAICPCPFGMDQLKGNKSNDGLGWVDGAMTCARYCTRYTYQWTWTEPDYTFST